MENAKAQLQELINESKKLNNELDIEVDPLVMSLVKNKYTGLVLIITLLAVFALGVGIGVNL